eukprot:COSAG02_NODE_852_length_16531_cov_9.899586_5_plen_401_part_00
MCGARLSGSQSASLCALAAASLLLHVPSVPCASVNHSRLRQDAAPIVKRVNWFISDSTARLPTTTKYLLEENREIVQGVYFCCGGGSFNATTGELTLGEFSPEVVKAFSDAGINTIMPTLGGDALPYAAWENREEIAEKILAWVLENNFTGIHNDWESHDDNGVDAYYFYDFWGAVAKRLHPEGKTVGTCIETAPANVSHPWAPRTLNNDTSWHSYMFSWDYAPTDTPTSMARAIDYMDVLTNMATYPMRHTTDGDNSWCPGGPHGFPNTSACVAGVEDFVDHLTPAYKYLEQEECNPKAHTVAKWCGIKGQVQNMLDQGADAASGQLSPGIWMNRCAKTVAHPTGITEQGWTQDSWKNFLEYLDTVGVRSVDMWTSLLSSNDIDTCEWFLPELKSWIKK